MTTWSSADLARAGKAIDDELTRQGIGRDAAASRFRVSSKTVERAVSGGGAPKRLVAMADELGLDRDRVMPPRDPDEQSQLDRIEGYLVEVLSLLRAAESPAGVAEAAAARIEVPLPEVEAARTRRKRRAQGA